MSDQYIHGNKDNNVITDTEDTNEREPASEIVKKLGNGYRTNQSNQEDKTAITNEASDVTENEEYRITALPNEAIGNVVVNYLDGVELSNIHNAGNKRFQIFARNSIQGAKLLVFNGGRGVNIPELIALYYKNAKIGSCKEVQEAPIDSKLMFRGKCGDEIIVGNGKQI